MPKSWNLIRPPGLAFDGRISEQLLGGGWSYASPRAYGLITSAAQVAELRDHPLSMAILPVYADFDTERILPVGPRGCGYVLLDTTIDGRVVVKEKEKVEAHVSGRRARMAALEGYVDFADIGNAIVALRRAAVLDSDWVADGRSESIDPLVAVNAADVKKVLKGWVDDFGPDILHDQEVLVECWCEAADLARSVGAILGEYGISVYSGSGDVPLPAIEAAAKRYEAALRAGKGVVALIVGDLDIDGVGNADRLVEDIEAHLPPDLQGVVRYEWVAPRLDILTRFPVLSPAAGAGVTRAGKTLTFTMQAEALVRGGALRLLLTEAAEEWLDMAAVEATRSHWDTVIVPEIGALLR
jgi:hypothetical protein